MGGGTINNKSYIHIQSSNDLDWAIAKIRYLDNDDAAYLAMLKEPFFIGMQHKAQLDMQLEAFLHNIFDPPLQKAYRRSTNSLGAFEERRYGMYIKILEGIKKVFPNRFVRFLKKCSSR